MWGSEKDWAKSGYLKEYYRNQPKDTSKGTMEQPSKAISSLKAFPSKGTRPHYSTYPGALHSWLREQRRNPSCCRQDGKDGQSLHCHHTADCHQSQIGLSSPDQGRELLISFLVWFCCTNGPGSGQAGWLSGYKRCWPCQNSRAPDTACLLLTWRQW